MQNIVYYYLLKKKNAYIFNYVATKCFKRDTEELDIVISDERS